MGGLVSVVALGSCRELLGCSFQIHRSEPFSCAHHITWNARRKKAIGSVSGCDVAGLVPFILFSRFLGSPRFLGFVAHFF